MSIRTRFLLLIGILSLLAIIVIAVSSYNFSINSAKLEAKNKGKIVLQFLASTRANFIKNQRPLIVKMAGPDRFYPEIMSGFAVTRGIWDIFSKKFPEYRLKQASMDPLHKPNKADSDEQAIIATFSQNPELQSSDGIIEKNGKKYFFFAKPARVMTKCLNCHGEPVNAPADMVEKYGTDSGFNWKVGDTIAAFVIYIPIQHALDQAKNTAIKLVAIGALSVAVMMLILWIFFSSSIIKPISMLEKRATEISLGKNLSETISTSSNDEIGSLARSIDRLRISVEKMLQRFKK